MADFQYTPEFIARVKKVYPDSPKMHELAEQNQYFLGRYLDDSASGNIHVNEILLATSLEELQAKARLEKQKVDLYREWGKIVHGR